MFWGSMVGEPRGDIVFPGNCICEGVEGRLGWKTGFLLVVISLTKSPCVGSRYNTGSTTYSGSACLSIYTGSDSPFYAVAAAGCIFLGKSARLNRGDKLFLSI